MATKVFFICGFPLLRSKPDAPSRPKKCKEISDRHPMGNDARLVAVPSSAHRSAMTMHRIVSPILALLCIAAQPLRPEEAARSEGRRVGNEWVSPCSSRWAPDL